MLMETLRELDLSDGLEEGVVVSVESLCCIPHLIICSIETLNFMPCYSHSATK